MDAVRASNIQMASASHLGLLHCASPPPPSASAEEVSFWEQASSNNESTCRYDTGLDPKVQERQDIENFIEGLRMNRTRLDEQYAQENSAFLSASWLEGDGGEGEDDDEALLNDLLRKASKIMFMCCA